MKKPVILLALLTLLAAACESSTSTPAAGAGTIAVTPSVTDSFMPSATFPPPSTATLQPIEGTLTTRVNVRSGPGTSYGSLGLLNAGEKVQITVRDTESKWYQIFYSAASDGRGWVAAQFVQIAAGTEVPLEATPTPAGLTGRIMQRLNVRSGPGMTFDSLGLLEADTTVSLTGKNTTASWFQIDYSVGPGGRGWVTAQYIQTDTADGLPVLDDYGNPVTPGAAETLSGPAMTLTPTVGLAFTDEDSRAAPAVRVNFSASGTHQFIYSSQVSAPQGDSEDWVEFTPYAASGIEPRLTFSLACTGNGTLTVELWRGGSPLSGWGTLECGDLEKLITLSAGQVYQIRLAPAAGEGLRLVDYVLTVQNKP